MIDLRKLRKIRTFGDSMHPLMKDQDIVHYRPIAFKEIRTGDVIVVQKNNIFITHRVIYKKSTSLITKGDSNPKPDELSYEKDIVGKVYMIERKRKKVKIEELYLMQSTIYYKEIVRLNNAFREAQINFVFLKGLLLHLYYQKSHPKRIYADCDILINKIQINKIDDIFYKSGYKRLFEKKSESLSDSDSNTEINYFQVVNGVKVIFDIHFAPAFMMTKFNINHRFYDKALLESLTGHFLEKKRKVFIDHNQFAILQKVELVAYLALHFFHHNYREIFRLQLIQSILEKDFSDSDWVRLEKFIKKYKIQNFIYPVFVLLKEYPLVVLPKFFLAKIHPKQFFTDILMIKIRKDVFTSQNRLQAGIERFLLLLLLSPEAFYKKLGVFVDSTVLKAVFKVLLKLF